MEIIYSIVILNNTDDAVTLVPTENQQAAIREILGGDDPSTLTVHMAVDVTEAD